MLFCYAIVKHPEDAVFSWDGLKVLGILLAILIGMVTIGLFVAPWLIRYIEMTIAKKSRVHCHFIVSSYVAERFMVYAALCGAKAKVIDFDLFDDYYEGRKKI